MLAASRRHPIDCGAAGRQACVINSSLRIALVAALALLAALAAAPAASARQLTIGMHGSDVRHMKSDLAKLGYLPRDAVSAEFDQRTWHAVVALQGWHGVTRDGVVGPGTRRAIRRAGRPLPDSPADGMEIHIDPQVLLVVRNGRSARAIHISSGSAGNTPYGEFRVYSRQVMSWSKPFKTWMPLAQYFTGGFAVHQNYSVPPYPASHGCVRVPPEESGEVWDRGAIGDRVLVTAGNRRTGRSIGEQEALDRVARRVAGDVIGFVPSV